MIWLGIVAIGAGVGFLAGLFGKGGSAIATPALHALGIPAIVAVAAPLPATIPGTAVAAIPYWRADKVDREVLRVGVVAGIGATVAGALLTRWVDGSALVTLTDAVLVVLGIRILVQQPSPDAPHGGPGALGPVAVAGPERPVAHFRGRLVAVSVFVGFTAGLLANSGGFLLAPLYLSALKLPVKVAFACSLCVAATLAIPGTIVHAALGHIDWSVVAAFGVASVPFSYLGARVALRTDSARLERLYGLLLVVAGAAFLLTGRS